MNMDISQAEQTLKQNQNRLNLFIIKQSITYLQTSYCNQAYK